MIATPVSAERVQKCVFNFEIYRFLKKTANLPHPFYLKKLKKLTRARPGVWATYARPGGGRMTAPPPENSKTKKDSDKQ